MSATSTNLFADQLDGLAEQLEMEVEMLSREWAMINERIGLKKRLASDLRREAESRREAGSYVLPPLTKPATNRPEVALHDNGRPGTSEAVLIVLAARHQPATTKEVYEEVERRGWLPQDAKSPRSAIKAALWSLGEKNRIERLGDKPATRRWAAKTVSQPPSVRGDGKAAT